MWWLAFILAVCLSGQLVAPETPGECQTRPLNKGGVLGDCGGSSEYVWWKDRGEHTPTIKPEDLSLVTVATNETDGFRRYARSAATYNLPVTVLGRGKQWTGGDMNYPGGGQKINLLKEYMEAYKEDTEKIVMFTDSYDVIVLAGAEKILAVFERLNARVVFSAEGFCWPDRTLASKYPAAPRGKRYLNSGGFIGYATELYKILTWAEVADKDDDQLFYTRVYLDEKARVKYGIKLDHKSEIFQNLNGAVDDVELRFGDEETFLANTVSGSVPLVVHGNGPTKLVLHTLGNYLAHGWLLNTGCTACRDAVAPLTQSQETYPVVLVAVFVEESSAFFEDFLDKIQRLEYPKQRIHLFIHNAIEFHTPVIDKFVEKHEAEYFSVKQIKPSDLVKDSKARSLAVEHCLAKKCDFYFNIDSEAHLDNPQTLKSLVEQNRSIIAPLLVRPYKLWSSFWGAMTSDGFYARSIDYMQIVQNERRGVWNVPYIRSCYLVNATILTSKYTRPSYEHEQLDSDMAFCNSAREKDIFMYVTNRIDFGHLVDNENFDTTKTNPDVYEIFNNRHDWERRYIHEEYPENMNPNKTIAQPCPDVYWFPIVSERFCKEFIEIMEAYGKWSDGTNSDERLDGGYENVPTRDIHMKQVGLDPAWMEFMLHYVRPLQEYVFTGYFHNDNRIQGGYENVPTRDIHMNQVSYEAEWAHFLMEYVRPLQKREFIGYMQPPHSLMNFVVRYRPDEQPSLRPHHDSSTYTINIGLNRPGIDYEGGGCRFIRYNCSVTNTRVGWMLMHPGRLTHYHEGLQVTSGTRYIMISFVDP